MKISLLAGRTPLRFLRSCSEEFGCKVYGKLEIYNPTGSHKDRESEHILRHALRGNVRKVAIASTGNAAISLAAYSYIYGNECHVYVPKAISAERMAQIRAYNPTISVTDSYDDAIAKCQAVAEHEGYLNCNPGARPEKLTGDLAIGSEIARKQKWTHVICPTNNGTLLAGVWTGLRGLGVRPTMVASVAKSTRFAEGIAGFHQFEKRALLKAMKESKGITVDVSDREISDAAQLLVSDGLIAEGAAAAGIAALRHVTVSRNSRICCVITGTGLKFPDSMRKLLNRDPRAME